MPFEADLDDFPQFPLPRDLLSSLPVETLRAMFSFPYTSSSPPAVPINRALALFDREERFRHVEVKSSASFVRLAQAIGRYDGEGWVKEIRMSSMGSVSDQRLGVFFDKASEISHLELGEGTTAAQRFVLDPRVSRQHLQKMVKITLTEKNGSKPFEPPQRTSLSSYPSLASLALVSTTHWTGVKTKKPSNKQFEKLLNITELTLKGSAADLPLIQPIINTLPALTSLILIDNGGSPHFCNILSLLPTTLTRLELRTPAFFGDHCNPVESTLSPFAHIRTLYLGKGTFSVFLFDKLPLLPNLHSLGFGPDALEKADVLERLVNASSSLRVLVLDIIETVKRGWRTREDGKGQLRQKAKHPKWQGPGWEIPPALKNPKSGFAVEKIVQAVEAIEAAGIWVRLSSLAILFAQSLTRFPLQFQVEGTTVDALKLYRHRKSDLCRSRYQGRRLRPPPLRSR